jgi:glycolate oxidase
MVDRAIEGHEEKAETAIRQIFAKTLELGGTMSGEHGVGVTKAPYLPMELDPAAVAYMKAVKRALDPNNILNPGKIFLEELPTAGEPQLPVANSRHSAAPME